MGDRVSEIVCAGKGASGAGHANLKIHARAWWRQNDSLDSPVNPKSFYPIILAGGRGTRFWPLSRKRRAKQLLALDGKQTMIQQTVARLAPMAPQGNFWIITNNDLRAALLRQLKKFPARQVIAEPIGRNTAPAIGLAAFLLLRKAPDAVLGLFPSDHVIAQPARFRDTLERGVRIAARGETIVVLGIRPTRVETGYGYIESGQDRKDGALRVRRFTEKPDLETARGFVKAGNYFWNSGMFLWRADTVANALREHLPNTAALLEKIAAAYGKSNFLNVLQRLYPKCDNISVDYAILEPRSAKGEGRSNIFCLPSDFGWNDLGSWTALHEHHVAKTNPRDSSPVYCSGSFALSAQNNYVHAPGKFVALVGVSNLVVVETEDALLVTTLERSQEVGKVVKHLDENKLGKLV
jgi:mannose-1-phosphate guanylyltransferase